MKVLVVVHIPKLTNESVPSLLEAVPFLKATSETSFELSMEIFEDSEINPLSLYELLQNDVDPEIVMVTIPFETMWLEKSFITEHIALLKGNIYSLDQFLYHVLLKQPALIPFIKAQLETLLEKEYIDSCVAYARFAMNASETAKNLYIHRNTLQYRFKVIEEKTGLSPKAFETIALFHACFH